MSFAQGSNGDTAQSDDNNDDNDRQYFDERSAVHEVYWIACDANRRNGPQILNHPDLSASDTDDGVSGVVDDYRFFNDHKQELIERITDDMDMYGLRKYRQDFEEPDEDMWCEDGTEYFFDGQPVEITGVHMIPEDVASDRFNVDYSKDGIDPIYVPILDFGSGGEIYEPQDFYESDDSQEESTESNEEDESTSYEEQMSSDSTDSTDSTTTMTKPDLPANAKEVQEWLEAQDPDDLNLQEQSTLVKLRNPQYSNRHIAEEVVDCSKNTVRQGLINHLGEDGYNDLKKRGKEVEETVTTSDDDDSTEQADSDRVKELEARVEALEQFIENTFAEQVRHG